MQQKLQQTSATTSLEWREYYELNSKSLLDIPWHLGGDLTEEERDTIAASVQDFQVGESSEGCCLFQSAKKYAEKSGDSDYVAAIKLFIAEEQRHSRDLARFLRQNNIPILKTTFLDRIFRQIRKLFGSLEISIAVLINAEIVAIVYYSALQQATNSSLLRTLCEQILHDERKHVEFHAEQLGKLRYDRQQLWQWIATIVQRLLYLVTCSILWHFHKKTFRKGGFELQNFWRSCWLEFDSVFAISDRIINSSCYQTSQR